MSDSSPSATPPATIEEIQQGWNELKLRVGELELERKVLQQENKSLRFLLERLIEHRQTSHNELILILSGLVGKLPLTDAGLIVSKLVEHNTHGAEVSAALLKGKAEAGLPQPAILRALDQSKRDLAAAFKPAVEELMGLATSFEQEQLKALLEKPALALSPMFIRACRCFVKGQVPRERVLREFGEEALPFFNDLTTDPKLNPRPKPDEIVLAFKPDFEALFAASPNVLAGKRDGLLALFKRVQAGKSQTPEGRAQRQALNKVTFISELTHFYANQNTELPEPIFAQRLPALVEQLGITGPNDPLDEKLVALVHGLLGLIVSKEHRLTVINNSGKGTPAGRSLRYILRLRQEKSPLDHPNIVNEVIPEFVKHLIPPPPQPPITPAALAQLLRLLEADFQKFVLRAVMNSDRMKRNEADALGRAAAKELGLADLGEEAKGPALSPEQERQVVWDKIKDLVTGRAEPSAIAAAIRDRLHAKYENDEIKQSWITLTEADPITFIRAFCQLPYLPDGKTDPIAKPVMEAYVVRLTHEKYAATYTKVVNSLKNMFKAKPDSPLLLNFIALVRWAEPGAAAKLSHDIGMAH
jgi:hypothetical protein